MNSQILSFDRNPISKVLTAARVEKIIFDPAEKEHRADYAYLTKHGKWLSGFCPYALEKPYTSVVDMCTAKLAAYAIRNELKEIDETDEILRKAGS
jgi:hypothetical protein